MEFEIPTTKFSDFVRLRKLDLFIICSSITMNRTVCQYTISVAGPTRGESRFHSRWGQCFLHGAHEGGKSAGCVTKHSPPQEGDGFNASLVPESLSLLRCSCCNAASTHNAALHRVTWRNMLCSESFWSVLNPCQVRHLARCRLMCCTLGPLWQKATYCRRESGAACAQDVMNIPERFIRTLDSTNVVFLGLIFSRRSFEIRGRLIFGYVA